jgi:AraC-like DNA-binding protein
LSSFSYLNRYPVLRSRDSEFARNSLFATYGADRFDKRDSDFGIEANLVSYEALGLAFCSYAGAASLSFPESGIVRQFFSIQGFASFRTSRESRVIGAWTPAISGDSRLDLEFAPGYRQLVIRLDAGVLERSLKSMLDDDSDRKLSFVDGEPDPALMALVRQDLFDFADEIEKFGKDYSAVAIAELERTLMFRFLLAHRHNFSDRLLNPVARANRSLVETVESYIEDHWDEAIDFEKLAAISNVSVRTIFREFSASGRGSPGQFAKHVRLRKAAELLRHPNNQTTVLGVAFKCGFRNPGRFSSEYRQAIGEMPSETLNRAKEKLGIF